MGTTCQQLRVSLRKDLLRWRDDGEGHKGEIGLLLIDRLPADRLPSLRAQAASFFAEGKDTQDRCVSIFF